MKLIYSELKKLLPSLDITPEKLRDDLSMIGHFCNYFEKIDHEIVFDLDIKVNRGDCLGYYGLARDLSILYNLALRLPNTDHGSQITGHELPITITATKDVTRIMAIKISGLKNTPSPSWLKQFLTLHQINSINTLVDLTNYIMLLWGIPNHAFDTAKSGENLIWELNSKFPELTTLDGVNLKLKPGILMVNSPSTPLSLSFLGGQACAIDHSTTEAIIEMAVYNPSRVRQDYKSLKTVTEAAVRLEKQLDPYLIPQAINHLSLLILEHCGGQITSGLFDYYPAPVIPPQIDFDLNLPSKISGISIPTKFAADIVKKVGHRPDITIPEDLAEEVIRFYGYQNIPINKPISSDPLPDITPKILCLIEDLKDKLVALGYDEIRSWPLTQKPLDLTAIKTQNSINSEYPYLRQSIIQSLEFQLDQYRRYKLPAPQFFEIGKIFYQQNGQYLEKYSLGLYHYHSDQLEKDLAALNLKSKTQDGFAEIILDDLTPPNSYSPKTISNQAIELTSQIITLDANITLPEKRDRQQLIREYQQKISENLLWQILITDEYFDPKANLYRYTFRVSYFNCTDKLAKSTHLSAFNLL